MKLPVITVMKVGDETVSSDAIREMIKSSDRVSALLGVSLIEARLETILKKIFVKNAKEVDNLFSDYQLLSGFYPKLSIARALNIISAEAFLDLKSIGSIRNMMAHNIAMSSFGNEKIAQRCLTLRLPERHAQFVTSMRKWVDAIPDNSWANELADPRTRFVSSVVLAFWKLSDEAYKKRVPDTPCI